MITLLYLLLTPNLMVNHLANYLNFWMVICHHLTTHIPKFWIPQDSQTAQSVILSMAYPHFHWRLKEPSVAIHSLEYAYN